MARNVRQAVLGNPAEDDAIMELSEEVYFLDGSREWTLSSQTTQRLDDRTVVETSLRQPLTALAQREVSYQLFKGDEVLASVFERRPDRLCAARRRCSPTSTPSATAAGRSGASRPRRSAGGVRPCST